VGIKLGLDKNGSYWLLDATRSRANLGDVDRLLIETATRDGKQFRFGFGKDPGQAGKSQALHLVRASLVPSPQRPRPVWAPQFAVLRRHRENPARRVERRPVLCPRRLPDLANDDEVDALEMLNPQNKGCAAYEWTRQRAEQLVADRQPTPPAKTQWAKGSMEWLVEQNKSS
jgi:hypothetical protein